MNPPVRGSRILVVDDDEGDRTALVAILAGAGYEAYEAVSGNDGLRVYLERVPHVVVTDVVMGDGDGIDLVSTLRRLKPDVGIIAVTGEGSAAAAAAKGMAVHRVLEKPVDAQALLEAVGELVKKGGGGG